DEKQRRNGGAKSAQISRRPHRANACRRERHCQRTLSRTRILSAAKTIALRTRCSRDSFGAGAFLRCVQTLAVCSTEQAVRAIHRNYLTSQNRARQAAIRLLRLETAAIRSAAPIQ